MTKYHICPVHGKEQCGIRDIAGFKCGQWNPEMHSCHKGIDIWYERKKVSK